MANFLIIVDPNASRLASTVRAIDPLLPPLEGLVTARCTAGDFCAVWAAERRAPVTWTEDQDGAAVVWGDAFRAADSRRVDGKEVHRLWRNVEEGPPAALNGYHAAAAYREGGNLVVGADILGFFPVYYYVSRDVALVGSSPELFRHHPIVRTELDPGGLAGILLTNGLVGGHTLLREVRRLSAGHLLVWSPGQLPREAEQYSIPTTGKPHEGSLATATKLAEDQLDRAVAEQIPPGDACGLLLSGGLDSRTLAGFLNRRNVPTVALTVGSSTAVETRCAAGVARELRCEHRSIGIPEASYPRYAQLQTRWEHCANGLNNLWFWGVDSPLRKMPSRVVMGLALDCVLGGPLVASKQPAMGPLSFQAVLSQMNSWAVPLEALGDLLRAEVFGDALMQTVNRLRLLYESCGKSEFKRAWRMELLHRQRFHVGGIAWQLSFGAWPVLPVLNQDLLGLAARLPETFHANRVVQKELLVRRFPRLASIPLCRNAYRTDLLIPTLRTRMGRWITKKIHRLGLLPRALGGARQRAGRLFYPLYDFNGEGWEAIRRMAEGGRSRVGELLDEKTLADLLPSPDSHCASRLPFESSGKKLLVELLIWSEEYLRKELPGTTPTTSRCVLSTRGGDGQGG